MRTNLHGFDPHPTFQTRTALRKLCPSPLALSATPTEVNDFGTSTRVILVYLFFPQLTRCKEKRKKSDGTSGRGVRSISKTLFGKQDKNGA